MRDDTHIVMMGYNEDWLTALDAVASPGSVTVIEEPDLYHGKGIAERAGRHACLDTVRLSAYQQSADAVAAAVEIAEVRPLRAVLPGLEYAVQAAANAAHALELPGAGPDAATALRDKLRLRRLTAERGMPAPAFAEVAGPQDIRAFQVAGRRSVLKPANRQASLGVILLEPGDDADAAWQACTEADEGPQVARRKMTWRYLIEERLDGQEISVEASSTKVSSYGRVLRANWWRTAAFPLSSGISSHPAYPQPS